VCWGRQKCSKIPFLKFDLAEFGSNLQYSSATVTLRMYVMGCAPRRCKDALSECTPFVAENPSQDFCRDRGLSGKISVNAVSCHWSVDGEPHINYELLRTLEVEQTPLELGSAFVDVRKDTWIEIPLDIKQVRTASEASQYSPADQLCLNIVADKSIDETIVIFGAQRDQETIQYKLQSPRCRSCDDFTRAGFGKMPLPQLVLVQGRSYNCTSTGCSADCSGDKGYNVYSDECTGTLWTCGEFDQPPGYDPKTCAVNARVREQEQLLWQPSFGACIFHMSAGTTIRDSRVQVRGTIEPLNVLLSDVVYGNPDPFNNAMGTNLENLTVSIRDTSGKYVRLEEGGWFRSAEEAKYTGVAKSLIRVIPRKLDPLEIDMVPEYSEPWVSALKTFLRK